MDKCFNFELIWNDVDVLQLRVSATNGLFAGTANVYVAVGALLEAVSKLTGFPRSPSDECELQFGEFGPNWAGGAIKMRFYCKGGAGKSFVETWIESEYSTSSIAETAHFHAPVEAHAVDAFVAELQRLEVTISGVARLRTALPSV